MAGGVEGHRQRMLEGRHPDRRRRAGPEERRARSRRDPAVERGVHPVHHEIAVRPPRRQDAFDGQDVRAVQHPGCGHHGLDGGRVLAVETRAAEILAVEIQFREVVRIVRRGRPALQPHHEPHVAVRAGQVEREIALPHRRVAADHVIPIEEVFRLRRRAVERIAVLLEAHRNGEYRLAPARARRAPRHGLACADGNPRGVFPRVPVVRRRAEEHQASARLVVDRPQDRAAAFHPQPVGGGQRRDLNGVQAHAGRDVGQGQRVEAFLAPRHLEDARGSGPFPPRLGHGRRRRAHPRRRRRPAEDHFMKPQIQHPSRQFHFLQAVGSRGRVPARRIRQSVGPAVAGQCRRHQFAVDPRFRPGFRVDAVDVEARRIPFRARPPGDAALPVSPFAPDLGQIGAGRLPRHQPQIDRPIGLSARHREIRRPGEVARGAVGRVAVRGRIAALAGRRQRDVGGDVRQVEAHVVGARQHVFEQVQALRRRHGRGHDRAVGRHQRNGDAGDAVGFARILDAVAVGVEPHPVADGRPAFGHDHHRTRVVRRHRIVEVARRDGRRIRDAFSACALVDGHVEIQRRGGARRQRADAPDARNRVVRPVRMAVVLHVGGQQVREFQTRRRFRAVVRRHHPVVDDLRLVRFGFRHELRHAHVGVHHAVGDRRLDGRLHGAVGAGHVDELRDAGRRIHDDVEDDGGAGAGGQRAAGPQVGGRAERARGGLGGVVGNDHAAIGAGAAGAGARAGAVAAAAAAARRVSIGAVALGAAAAVAAGAAAGGRRRSRLVGRVVAGRAGSGGRSAAAAVGAVHAVGAVAAVMERIADARGRRTARRAGHVVLDSAAAAARQHARRRTQAEPRVAAGRVGRAAGADVDRVVAAGQHGHVRAAVGPAAAAAAAAVRRARRAAAAAAPRLHRDRRDARGRRERGGGVVGQRHHAARRIVERGADAVGNVGDARWQDVFQRDAGLRHGAGVLDHDGIRVRRARREAGAGGRRLRRRQAVYRGDVARVAGIVRGPGRQVERRRAARDGRGVAVNRVVAALVRRAEREGRRQRVADEVRARHQIGEGVGAGGGRRRHADDVRRGVVERDHHARHARFAAAVLHAVAVDVAPDEAADGRRRLGEAGIARRVRRAAGQREDGRAAGVGGNIAVERVVAALVLRRGQEIRRRDELEEVRTRRQVGEGVGAGHARGRRRQQVRGRVVDPHRHAGQPRLSALLHAVAVDVEPDEIADRVGFGEIGDGRFARRLLVAGDRGDVDELRRDQRHVQGGREPNGHDRAGGNGRVGDQIRGGLDADGIRHGVAHQHDTRAAGTARARRSAAAAARVGRAGGPGVARTARPAAARAAAAGIAHRRRRSAPAAAAEPAARRTIGREIRELQPIAARAAPGRAADPARRAGTAAAARRAVGRSAARRAAVVSIAARSRPRLLARSARHVAPPAAAAARSAVAPDAQMRAGTQPAAQRRQRIEHRIAAGRARPAAAADRDGVGRSARHRVVGAVHDAAGAAAAAAGRAARAAAPAAAHHQHLHLAHARRRLETRRAHRRERLHHVRHGHRRLRDRDAAGHVRRPRRQHVRQEYARLRHRPRVRERDLVDVGFAQIPVARQQRGLGNGHAHDADGFVGDARREGRGLLVAGQRGHVDEFQRLQRIVDRGRHLHGHVRQRGQLVAVEQRRRRRQRVGGVRGRSGEADVVQPDVVGRAAPAAADEPDDRARRGEGRDVVVGREIRSVVGVGADLPHFREGAAAVGRDLHGHVFAGFQPRAAVVQPQHGVRVARQVRPALDARRARRPQRVGLARDGIAVHGHVDGAARRAVVVARFGPGPGPRHVAVAVGVGLPVEPIQKIVGMREAPDQFRGNERHPGGQRVLEPEARLRHGAGVGDLDRVDHARAADQQVRGVRGLQQRHAGGGVDGVRHRIGRQRRPLLVGADLGGVDHLGGHGGG